MNYSRNLKEEGGRRGRNERNEVIQDVIHPIPLSPRRGKVIKAEFLARR